MKLQNNVNIQNNDETQSNTFADVRVIEIKKNIFELLKMLLNDLYTVSYKTEPQKEFNKIVEKQIGDYFTRMDKYIDNYNDDELSPAQKIKHKSTIFYLFMRFFINHSNYIKEENFKKIMKIPTEYMQKKRDNSEMILMSEFKVLLELLETQYRKNSFKEKYLEPATTHLAICIEHMEAKDQHKAFIDLINFLNSGHYSQEQLAKPLTELLPAMKVYKEIANVKNNQSNHAQEDDYTVNGKSIFYLRSG